MISDSLPFSSPILLAPLAGYTDYPFRKICRRFGAGMVYTELISADALVRKNKKTLQLMRIFDDERPAGIQLFGRDAAVMAEGARFAEELGPDLIDINMGCCAQKICSNGAGAALSRNIPLLHDIAKSVVTSVSVPVTAKIRLGWDEKSKNYIEIVDALQDAGITAVTVHGRTRMQQYSGHADWDAIEKIARYASVPVIGNGDIISHEQAVGKIESTSCCCVMAGRGALGNPWIFSGTTPSMQERIELVKHHIAEMAYYYGEYGIILARKHTVKYFHHTRSASHIRKELVQSTTLAQMNAILDKALEGCTLFENVPHD